MHIRMESRKSLVQGHLGSGTAETFNEPFEGEKNITDSEKQHPRAKDDDGRIQPWRQILEGVADHHESDEGNDFFACSHGFYTQSLAG